MGVKHKEFQSGACSSILRASLRRAGANFEEFPEVEGLRPKVFNRVYARRPMNPKASHPTLSSFWGGEGEEVSGRTGSGVQCAQLVSEISTTPSQRLGKVTSEQLANELISSSISSSA